MTLGQMAVPSYAAAQNAAVLSASDQDLLNRVRQAGLWEMPAGAMAMTRADSDDVKQVGRALMVDHGRLDVAVRDLAAKYRVTLPDQPNKDQQSWLNEMVNARNGAEFQQIFANRLRAAHGTIFGIIGQVRAGTKNDDIRAFAATANQVVLRHISLLESTGMVDYGKLPDPQTSTATTSATQSLNIGGGALIALVVLFVVFGFGTIMVLRMARSPRKKRIPARVALAEPQPEP